MDDILNPESLNWPEAGVKLFQAPTDETPLAVRCAVDWMVGFGEGWIHASAFKDGADLLVEALLKGGDGGHPDRFIYPVVYLYRHAAELALKQFLFLPKVYASLPQCSPKGNPLSKHDLMELWRLVRPVAENLWPHEPSEQYDAVESMIQELHRADPDGQTIRYPNDRGGKANKPDLPSRIDLLSLRKGFDSMWQLLGTLDAPLDSSQ